MKSPLNKLNVIGRTSGLAAALLASAVLAGHAVAGSATTETSVTPPPASNSLQDLFSDWWNGQYASGNWFGVRDTLEDHGLTLGGSWKGFFYGVVSGKQPAGGFDEELKFTGHLDFAKLTGVAALEGLTFDAAVRYRDGTNPNSFVGAQSAFQPSNIESGKSWRLMPFYATYSTPEVLGIKNFLTISGGWQNPYDFFLQQPLSKLFVNNAITTAKGLGGNIQWSSSYAAWGGYTKIKPTSWSYAQAGLYEAIPNAYNSGPNNYGLDLAGVGPNTNPFPGPDGLEALGEVGLTPTIGPSELPGHYAFGGYYYGLWNKSYYGVNYPGKYGFYWQADQMLWRVPSPAATVVATDGKAVADGKESKEVAPVLGKQALSDKGLYYFSMLSYAPAYNNALPFYFQTGLVYKGLIPTRDNDQLGFAFGYGSNSIDNINNLQSLSGKHPADINQPNYTAVLEWDYRIQVTKFAYFQPFVQYIINPLGSEATGAGTSYRVIPNAAILGWSAGVVF